VADIWMHGQKAVFPFKWRKYDYEQQTILHCLQCIQSRQAEDHTKLHSSSISIIFFHSKYAL